MGKMSKIKLLPQNNSVPAQLVHQHSLPRHRGRPEAVLARDFRRRGSTVIRRHSGKTGHGVEK